MTRLRTERLALTALFAAAAMILSYVETVLPIEFIVPIPGFKLGLANLAVSAALIMLGPVPALGVSLCRIFLNFMLFGSLPSLWFSLAGGLFSFSALIIWRYILVRHIGIAGLSVMCAVMHNIGQCFAAWIMFGGGVVMAWIPILLLISPLTGTITGVILYFFADRLTRVGAFSGEKKGNS